MPPTPDSASNFETWASGTFRKPLIPTIRLPSRTVSHSLSARATSSLGRVCMTVAMGRSQTARHVSTLTRSFQMVTLSAHKAPATWGPSGPSM
eukprot:8711163-Alexandrium_andersonii.AAC.1